MPRRSGWRAGWPAFTRPRYRHVDPDFFYPYQVLADDFRRVGLNECARRLDALLEVARISRRSSLSLKEEIDTILRQGAS